MPVGEYSNNIGGNVYGVHLTSDKMFNDLCSHGCVPNKSLVLTFPKDIPENLIHHFIRGYFDGDGSVFILNHKWIKNPKTNPVVCYRETLGVGFNGTKEFLSGLNTNFNIGTIAKEKRRTTNC